MTFEEWLIAQYAMHTDYGNSMQSGKQSDIKEYMEAAWTAGWEDGNEHGYDRGYYQGTNDATRPVIPE